MIPGSAGGRAVSHSYIQVAVGVDGRSGRRPDTALARGRNLKSDQRAVSIGAGTDDQTMVVSTVAVQPAKWHIHHVAEKRQRTPLLMGSSVGSRRIYRPRKRDLPGGSVQTYQLMNYPAACIVCLRHRQDLAGLRVIHRRASYTERVYVAAGKLVHRHRRADRRAPEHVTRSGVQRVDHIMF